MNTAPTWKMIEPMPGVPENNIFIWHDRSHTAEYKGKICLFYGPWHMESIVVKPTKTLPQRQKEAVALVLRSLHAAKEIHLSKVYKALQ